MIRTRATACLRRAVVRPNVLPGPQRCRITTSTQPAPAQSASGASPLATISTELDKIAPRFDISPDAIEIIQSPSGFYETLKDKISKAKRRIYLATLYIGKAEHELIDTVRQALKTNPDLHVSFLTDALRGTRETPEPSCASLLASLITEFGPARVEVRLYHTPNLAGFRKSIIPKRINEGWGLQHMKLYGIDDEIIMSGANLSNDYFTNRQDRYHVFKSKQITDYFFTVHQAVCSLSYNVVPSGEKDDGGFRTEWPAQNAQPAPLEDPKQYIDSANAVLQKFTQARWDDSSATTNTQVYPLLQLTPLLKPDTSTELPALSRILDLISKTPSLIGSRWTFTAGYFNMTPHFRSLLLSSHPSSATVIAASPWANGFYGSKGVSGLLPPAYTLLSRNFLDAVDAAKLSDNIKLREWRKGTVNTPGGWTYHAKGIWITLPGEKEHGPSVSVVGSSNYTERSYKLDLEANCLIVTSDESLRKRLGDEETWLQENTQVMTREDYAATERRVGLHVRVAMAIVKLVGGAL